MKTPIRNQSQIRRKIIATTFCQLCGACPGQKCDIAPGPIKFPIHWERKALYEIKQRDGK